MYLPNDNRASLVVARDSVLQRDCRRRTQDTSRLRAPFWRVYHGLDVHLNLARVVALSEVLLAMCRNVPALIKHFVASIVELKSSMVLQMEALMGAQSLAKKAQGKILQASVS